MKRHLCLKDDLEVGRGSEDWLKWPIALLQSATAIANEVKEVFRGTFS
jgi:hypothetical protein